MDGWILVDKPVGMSSFQVVKEVKKVFKTSKVGHCGTLDPFATGLLAITINNATKISHYIENGSKEYIATLKLGEKTDSGDLTGNIILKKDIPPFTKENIKNVLNNFQGKIKQTPPMYSALKMNGEPLYKLARKGIEVERKEREVEIYNIELIDYKNNVIVFKVNCSKGTYVRTLGEDIAARLGTIGHLTDLRRTKIGSFDLEKSVKFDMINEQIKLFSIEEGLIDYPSIYVNEEDEKKVKNGQRMNFISTEDVVVVYNNLKKALAIYKKEDNEYHCLRGI